MTIRRFAVMTIGMLSVGLLSIGCIPQNNTLTAAASGAAKLSSGNASDLTGSEIQALIEIANAAIPEVDLDVNAEQAAALADFLSTNNINNQDDFTNLVDAVTSGEQEIAIDEAVVALFVQDFEPEVTEQLSNQGGGSLTSGLTKVINQDLGSLTADELQILGQSIDELDIGGEQEAQELTDDQAAAIVTFIALNDIDTVGEFEDLDENNVEIPEGAEELFEGL